MTNKRLLNPDPTKKDRSNSRSKSRTKLQGRQFRKIKVVHRDVRKKTNSSKDSSAGGANQKDKPRPIIDMSSLRRGHGRGEIPGNNNKTQRASNERVVVGEATAMSTFTRTTVAESDSDDERRAALAVSSTRSRQRQPPQQRQKERPSASGATRATPSSRRNTISTGDSKVKTKRRSPSKTRATKSTGGDRSRSSGDVSRSSSRREVTSVNSGAIVPYRKKNSKSSLSDNDDEDDTKRCPRHPSIILQEKIYGRWLVIRSDCPFCDKGNSGDACKSGGHKKSGGEAKRSGGFMKRLGERSRQISRPRSKPMESGPRASPLPSSSRGSRASSPVRSFGSTPSRRSHRSGRHRSPSLGHRRSASRRRSSSSSGSSSSSPMSRSSSSRSPPRASSLDRSNSPPPSPRRRLSDDKPSFRQRGRSVSFSPPRSRSQLQDRHAPSSGRFTPGREKGRAGPRGAAVHSNNNETALVVRQRTPSPSNSVELNPLRFPRGGKPNRVGGGSSLSPPTSNSPPRQPLNSRRGRSPSRGRSTSSNSMGRPPSHRRPSMGRSPSQPRGPTGRNSSPRRPVSQRRNTLGRSPSQPRGSMGRSPNQRPGPMRRSISPQNSIGKPPSRRGDSMGRSPSQRRGTMRRSISPQNSIGRPPNRPGNSMGRPQSQRRGPMRRSISPENSIARPPSRPGEFMGRPQSQLRDPMRRSISPQNSIGRPPSRRGEFMGRPQSQRRGPMRRSISPQNSIGRPPSRRGDSMGRPPSQRRGPMRRSISPENSIGRPPNRRGDSMGRPSSQRRGPLTSSRSFSPSNPMGRPQGQRRGPLASSRSFSPFQSTGRPDRDRGSMGRPQSQRRGPVNRSISPQNSIRKQNQLRSISRSSRNSVGLPIQPHQRRWSRRSRSRSPSPYNSIRSRSLSPYNSIGRRSPGGYSSPSSRSLSSSMGSSSEFQSKESSVADYFDDQHGEVVLHVKGKCDRRPSVISRRIDSFDDFFAPALDGGSPPRRRNSFNESFDRMPDRGPPSRRSNSFNESFDRMPPSNFDSRPNRKRNSFEDSFDRTPSTWSRGRCPPSRTKNSFGDSLEDMSKPSAYYRDTSFDRMRERIETSRRTPSSFISQESSLDRVAKRMSRQSFESVGNASHEITSNRSVGMEWSDHNQVKSKSKDLSLLIRQLNRPNRISGGRSVVSSVSRVTERSAASSVAKLRRNTAMLDRSLSPLPRLKDRAVSLQAEQRLENRSRSASVGPGLRSGDNKSVGSSHRGNSAAQRKGNNEISVDMANVNMALKNIAAFPHVRSETMFPLPEIERASHGLPNGSGSTGSSLKIPRKSKSQVRSETNFPLPVKHHSPRRSSNGTGSVGSKKANTASKERHNEPLHRVPSESSFPLPVKQHPSSHSHYQSPRQVHEDTQRNQNRSIEGHPDRSSNFPPPPPPPPPPHRAVMSPEPLPPYQNQPWVVNEHIPPENDDWRMYQIDPNNIANPPIGMEELNVHRSSHPHQQGNQYQENASGNLSVGQEDGERYGLTADQRSKGQVEWMKYKVGDSKSANCEPNGNRSVSSGRKGRSKMFGRTPQKQTVSDRQAGKTVKQMPFTDQFGDFGMYTGQVDDDGRPHGKGSMKYDNGVFYEGTWTNGCQDQKAASQYGRIRGGFTSWQGQGRHATKSGMVLPWNARKNDAPDPNAKTNVRGMEWTDLNGDSGRYTGEVNSDKMPHGFGVMKYDFGLIAEGDWNNGVLKEGPQDRMISAAASMMSGARSVAGSMSIGPGMSVGPGVRGFSGASVGPMSVGPMSVGPMSVGPMSIGGAGVSIGPGSSFSGIGGMPMMFPRPMLLGGMNPAMMGRAPNTAQQHLMIAQQNAAMKSMGAMMYGGGSVVYGGPSGPLMHQGQMPPPMMPMPMPPMQMMQGVPPPEHNRDKPPISEIKIPP